MTGWCGDYGHHGRDVCVVCGTPRLRPPTRRKRCLGSDFAPKGTTVATREHGAQPKQGSGKP